MSRLLVAFALLVIIFGTSQVAGREQSLQQRSVQSAAAVQTRPSDLAIRKVSARRAISATSDFRAEDLIPDICKGCSS
jgi:hypothetical protein